MDKEVVGDPIPLIMEREAGAPEHIAAMLVGFGIMQMTDAKASAKAGYPVFKDVEFFRAKVPGDKQSEVLAIAKDKDRARYPRAYAAFKQRGSVPIQGLPIEQWPQISRGQAVMLKSMDIHTVECLAEVHDGHIDKLGQSGRELRTKAKAFLAQAKDSAEAQRLAAESERKDAIIAEMQRQLKDLAARIEQPTKRGPGRPRKDDQSEAAA
jgi:hypothetical protein